MPPISNHFTNYGDHYRFGRNQYHTNCPRKIVAEGEGPRKDVAYGEGTRGKSRFCESPRKGLSYSEGPGNKMIRIGESPRKLVAACESTKYTRCGEGPGKLVAVGEGTGYRPRPPFGGYGHRPQFDFNIGKLFAILSLFLGLRGGGNRY